MRKQIKMYVNFTTRSSMKLSMLSWGFNQCCTLYMYMVLWLPMTSYCYNYISTKKQLCYWFLFSSHQGEMWTKLESCTPPTKLNPSTNNAHSSNIKYQRKLNICLGEFQDSWNDAMHEDNPPNKDSYALIKVPKPPPIVNWKPFKNVGVQQKTCMQNNSMVEATKRSTKIWMTSIKSSIDNNCFTTLDIEKLYQKG
jgi:hypothetical protein